MNLAAEQELLRKLSRRGFALVPRQALQRALELPADEAAHDDLLIDQIQVDARLEFVFLVGANLSAFGDVQLAGTVKQAVGRLGRRKIASLLWLTALADFYLAQSPVDEQTRTDLFRHSLLTGLVARQLQAATRVDSTDDALIAGIAHNVGNLLLAGATPRLTLVGGDEIGTPVAGNDSPAPDACRLGALLLEIWNAPPAVISCARHFQDPREALAEYQPLLALVRLAERLARVLESDPPSVPLVVEALPEWQALTASAPGNEIVDLASMTVRQLPESLLAANHLVTALGG